MREIFITAIIILSCCYSTFLKGDPIKPPVPLVAIYSYGGLSWSIKYDIGESPAESVSIKAFLAEHYFYGDPVFTKLLVSNESLGVDLTKKDFESVLKCTGLAIFKIPDGKVVRVSNIKMRPIITVPLHQLNLDLRDPRHNKKVYRASKAAGDGIYTEWFELSKVINTSLPPGIYQLSIIKDTPSCGYRYTYNSGNYRIIEIHGVASKKLKAMKLCWNGMKSLRPAPGDVTDPKILREYNRRLHDQEFMQGLVKEYFLTALEIYPDLKCAQRHMAAYYKLIDDRNAYKKYYTAYCSAPWDTRWENKCFRSMKAQLKKWKK